MKSVKIEGGWAMAACAFGWSLAGVFMKFVNINSFAMSGFRSLFALITIITLSRRTPRFVIRSTGDKPPVDKKRTLYLWLAALNYAVTMILFCLCNKLTYSANAVLLQYTNPAWIIILGPFIVGEKTRRIDYVTIAGVAIGMLLFFADNLFGTPSGEFSDTVVLGNILALVSGVTFGLTTIFQRKQQMLAKECGDETNSNSSSDAFMIAQIITALFGLSFIFFKENSIPDLQSLIFLLLLGIFQMGIPNVMYSKGIKNVPALSASLITMLEPLMNPIWVLIFVHEIPSWSCILGGVLILGFILLREVVSQKKPA